MCGPAEAPQKDALVPAEVSGALHVLRGGRALEDDLHEAVSRGDEAGVKALLAAGADKDGKNSGNQSPLHQAVSNGRIDVVRLLLSAGANTEAKDNNGWTPLHDAAGRGVRGNSNLELVQVLLGAGADKMARNAGYQTPWRVAKRSGREELAKLLWEW
ncbi:ankyrin repeat-containing domain protein [Baffinella frigidus]|nr:ankyrin repeat-containing domain protein [Cryptophyta sp. CCMP2293]